MGILIVPELQGGAGGHDVCIVELSVSETQWLILFTCSLVVSICVCTTDSLVNDAYHCESANNVFCTGITK